MSQKLSKSFRLRHKKDFEQLRRASKKLTIHPLVFYFSKNEEITNARIAFSVSSKQYNAVQRNRIKRILRDLFRKNQAIKNTTLDIMIVVISKSEEKNYLSAFNKFIEKVTND